MSILRYISINILLLFVCCGMSPRNVNKDQSESRNLIQDIDSNSEDSLNSVQQLTSEYILFGVYCGECSGHCATMYRYNMIGNTATLFVDSTDSYFKNSGNIKFNTPIHNPEKFAMVNSIVMHIPPEFFTTLKNSESFGCPDCTDGCGIYFELKIDSKVKKFYIDYQTSQLTGEIKVFAEYLKTMIAKLNK